MTRFAMITEFLPTPADSGGKLRSLAEASRLADVAPLSLYGLRDGEVDMRALDDLGIQATGANRPRSLGAIGRGLARAQTVTAARFWSEELARAIVGERATPVDLLLVGHAQMAPYAGLLPARHKVLDLHNVESALIESYRSSVTGVRSLAAGVEAAALRRLERKIMRRFDTVLVVSDTDRRRLPVGTADVIVCPNGTALGKAVAVSDEPVAVFVALMGWTPNAEAAVHLVTYVWPGVRARVPGARLILVGRDPTPAVRSLSAPDIEVTGTVESVAPYLARARVALAPLLAGGGSRLKILEALAAGRPVVATTVGAEGLEDLVGSGVVTADGAPALAEAIADLLIDPGRAGSLGRAGRAAVVEHYGWDATLAPLIALAKRMAGEPPDEPSGWRA